MGLARLRRGLRRFAVVFCGCVMLFAQGSASALAGQAGVASVIVVAEPGQVPADGVSAAVLSVQVLDAYGEPLAAVPVSFGTDFGTLQGPTTRLTDGAGGVTDAVYSTTAGYATVTATAEGVTGTASVSFYVPGPSGVRVWASSENVAANGTDTAQITAQVVYADGLPAVGVPVTFSTSLGSVGLPASRTTGVGGEVSDTVYSGTSGTANVTVTTANGVQGSTGVYFYGVPAPPQNSGGIWWVSGGGQYFLADGPYGATLTAQLWDGQTDEPLAGVPVQFSTSLGYVAAPSLGVTNADGEVSATVYSSVPGEASVTAVGANGTTGSTYVTFVAASQVQLQQAGWVTSQCASGQKGFELGVNAVDPHIGTYGVSVDGVPVHFSTTLGTVVPAAGVTSSWDGSVWATVYSETPGMAVVTATAEGASLSTTADFCSQPAPPPTVQVGGVQVSGTSVLAGAGGPLYTTVTATVCTWLSWGGNYCGGPVAGIPVSFSTDSGSLQGPEPAVTNASGEVSVTVYGVQPGSEATVTATADGVSGSTTVNFYVPSQLRMSLTGGTSYAGTPVYVGAQLLDRSTGQPADVAGVPVTLSTTFGVLSQTGPLLTSQSGSVAASVYSAVPGSGTITAAAPGGLTASAGLSFLQRSRGFVWLEGSAYNAPADGKTLVQVTATVEDPEYYPVSGVTVTFGTNLGGFAGPSSGITNASGQVSAEVYSATAGTATVTAAAAGVSQSIELSFLPTGVAAVQMWIVPNSVPVGTASPARVTAKVVNGSGQPVSGVPVQFATNFGDFSGPASGVTNAAGEVTATVYSPVAGAASVSAVAEGKSGVGTVTFYSLQQVTLFAWPTRWDVPVGGTTTVTVRALNGSGTPVSGVAVGFQTDLGGFVGAPFGVTNAAGEVSVTVYSQKVGTADVLASGQGATTAVGISYYMPRVDTVNIFSPPEAVPVGGATGEVVAQVVDQHGSPMAGVPVSFSTDFGYFSGPASGITGTQGTVSAAVYSPFAGGADVSAVAGGVSSWGTVIQFVALSPGPSPSIQVWSSQQSVPANGSSTAVATALVLSGDGQPMAGVPVTFRINAGSVGSPSTLLTNAQGEVSDTVYAPAAGAAAAVTATTADGQSATAPVLFYSPIVAQLLTWGTANAVPANGQSAASVGVQLLDQYGNPVAGVPVSFTTSLGRVSEDLVPTDYNGNAQISITSDNPGTAVVTVAAGGKSGTVLITFSPYVPPQVQVGGEFVWSSPSAVPADGTSAATVTISVWGRGPNYGPLAGIPVAVSTDLGSLSSSTVTTDAAGQAQITVTSATPGAATVTALAGGGGCYSWWCSDTTRIDFYNAARTHLELSVSSDYMPADGSSTTTVTADVVDWNGEAVAGVPVTFSTTLGVLGQPSTVTADSSGLVSDTVYSSQAGVATITASSPGLGSASAEVTFYPPVSVGTVQVSGSPTHVPLNGVDGSQITAMVLNQGGAPVAGVPVTFSTSLGTVSGSGTGISGANGEVLATIYSATPGTAEVTADAGGKVGATAITFYRPAASKVVFSPWGNRNDTGVADGTTPVLVQAQVLDQYGKPLAGVPVTISALFGTVQQQTVYSDSSGNVYDEVYSLQAGSDPITATTASGVWGTWTVWFNSPPPPPSSTVDSVQISAQETSCLGSWGCNALVPADGTSTATITVQLVDANGQPSGPEIPVALSTNFGALGGPTTMGSDSSGAVTDTVYSSQAGVATITATAGGKSASTEVTFYNPTAPAQVWVNAYGVGVGLSATVSATVTDAVGDPIPGVPVTMSTSFGRLTSPVTQLTNINGEVYATVYSAALGQATVTATAANGVSGSAQMYFYQPEPVAIGVGASPQNVVADGKASAIVTAQVWDQYNSPVAGVPVSFQSNQGVLSATTATTNDEGQAQVALTSDSPGQATVTARIYNGPSGTATVDFYRPVPTWISVSAYPTSVPADGVTTSTVTAQVVDQLDNPLAGVPVSFGTDLGSIAGSASGVTDALGEVAVAVYSAAPGTATVTAGVYGGPSGTAAVTFTAAVPAMVQIWASPTSVPADGSSVATVTALVQNAAGAPLAGDPVTFSTDLGGLSGPTTLVTGGNGEVSTSVYSSTAGMARITATIGGGMSDSTVVDFWPTGKYLLFTSDAGKATQSVWGQTLPGLNCAGGCGSTAGHALPWTFGQVTFLVNQPSAGGDVYIVGDAAAGYDLTVSFTCGTGCVHDVQGSFNPAAPGTVIDLNTLQWFNEGGGQGRTVTISLVASGARYGVGNIYLYATGGDQLYDLSASAAPMVQPGSAQGTVGQEVGIPLEVQSAPLPMNSITVDNGAAVSFDPSILKLDAVSGGPGTSVQWSNITASNLTFALSAPVGLTAGTQAATLDFTCLAPGTSVVTLNGGQYTTPEPWWSSSGLSQASGQITCTAPGTPIGISGFTPGAVPQATPGSDVPVNMTITGWGLNTVRSVELLSQDGGANVVGSVVAAAVYTGSVGVTFGGVPLGAYKVEVTGAGGDVAQSTGEFLVAPGIPMFSVTQQAFWSMAPGATYTHTWIVSNQGLVPGVALVMVRFPNGVSATACPNTDVLYYANGAALVAVPVAAESSTTFCFQEVLPPSQVQYPGQPSNPGSANVPINSEQSTNTLLVGSLTQQQWNGLQGQPTAEILAQGLVDTTNADGQYAQEIGQMPDAEAFTTALYGSLPGFSPSYGVVNGTADINSSSFLWNAPSGQDAQYFILGLLLEYIATFVPPSNGEMPSISELGIETIMDFGKSVGLQTISSVLDNQYFGAGETFGLKLATIISCVGALIPELTMFLLAPCIMGVVDLIVASMDPNSLAAAPPGAGSENYVLNGQTLGVQVHFENSPKANAPAQNVRVDVQLGQNLDPASVRLVYYTTSTPPVISVTPAGLVRFYFNNLDLPPDVNPPAGEDMVEFTVSPRPDLADNAPLTVSGNVYFDYNPPVATQVLTYHIDAVNPVASVAPLPGVSPANFVVNWSGTDPGGPGIQGYTVLVSVNGGPYQTWQSDTTITSAVYDGQPGNTYSFVALAQDLLGQTQAMPSQAQASTTVAVVAGGGSGGSNGGGSAPVTVPAAAMSVGSAGGTVSAADGAVVVDVPPGAFTSMTSVQVTALPTSQDHEPPGKSFVGASPQWTISAGGAEPAKPVLATFRYDPGALGGLSPRRLGVYGYDPGKGAWQWVGGRVYAADDTVSAELPSFGTYAVFADVATFKDMGQASWARDAVDTLLGANMVVGMAPGVFEPNGLLTRAQFATLLVKADGLAPQRFTPTPFTDVAPTAWYAPYVAAAYRAGLVAGVGSGSFAPDAPVTREEMAVMLSKAILEDDGSHSLARFSDAGSVASWARAGVEAVVGAGIMTGFPDGTFRPRSVATRAQAAAVVASYLGYAGKA